MIINGIEELSDITSFDLYLMPEGDEETPGVGGENPDDDDEEADA